MTDTTRPGPVTALPAGLVSGIDHVGVATSDLESTITWYATNLGFVELHRETNTEQKVVEAMLGPAGTESSQISGVKIQVLAPLDETSTIATYLDKRGPGIQQMAVRVTDLAAVSAHLNQLGTRLLYPEPKRGTADSLINFIHPKDAGGVLLELVQPA